MAKVVVAVQIPRSPEEVWADLEQLETHVEWMADAERIDFVGEQRRGVGTTMRVLTKVGPIRTTDVIRVRGWEPPRSIAVRHEGIVAGEGEFVLIPSRSGTRFVWTEDLAIPWYLGGPVAGVIVSLILAVVWRRNLKRLAARFE